MTIEEQALELLDTAEARARTGDIDAMEAVLARLQNLKVPFDTSGYASDIARLGYETAIPILVEQGEHYATLGEAYVMERYVKRARRAWIGLGLEPPERFPFEAQGYGFSAQRMLAMAAHEGEQDNTFGMDKGIRIARIWAELSGIEIDEEQLAFRDEVYERSYAHYVDRLLELELDAPERELNPTLALSLEYSTKVGAAHDPRIAIAALNAYSYHIGELFDELHRPEHDLGFLVSCATISDDNIDTGSERFFMSLIKDPEGALAFRSSAERLVEYGELTDTLLAYLFNKTGWNPVQFDQPI